MKAKITRVNGIVIELEGTDQEVATVLAREGGFHLIAQAPSMPIFVPTVNIYPNDMCPQGGVHQYDLPYVGDGHPPCKKCGNQYTSLASITTTLPQS